MARTLLTYSVQTEDVWDFAKDRVVRKVKNRGFDFSVSSVKSEEEARAYIDSFLEYLFAETGIDARNCLFGSGERECPIFASIAIETMEEKTWVKDCYVVWKKQVKPSVTIGGAGD